MCLSRDGRSISSLMTKSRQCHVIVSRPRRFGRLLRLSPRTFLGHHAETDTFTCKLAVAPDDYKEGETHVPRESVGC